MPDTYISGRASCTAILRRRHFIRWWRVWNAINDIAHGDIPVTCPLCHKDIAIHIGFEHLDDSRSTVVVEHVPLA